jgi:hypothetical protein
LHVAVPTVVPVAREHVAEVGVNVPVELVEKLTVPVGVVAPVDEVSLTVAVQLVVALTWTGDGLQEAVVLVV